MISAMLTDADPPTGLSAMNVLAKMEPLKKGATGTALTHSNGACLFTTGVSHFLLNPPLRAVEVNARYSFVVPRNERLV
jgi:hypothetical protein